MDAESGSGRFGTPTRQLNDYEIRVRSLSDRLVAAQRPLRILDAIKWDHAFERAFFAAGCREQPPVTRAYYETRPLSFDPAHKREEFTSLERDIRRDIGASDGPGRLMVRMCREYRDVVDMLTLRGTPEFSRRAMKLYGTSAAVSVTKNQESPLRIWPGASDRPVRSVEKTLNAQEAVDALTTRLQNYFDDSVKVRVRLSDGILADAAAGCDYIKIRGSARFTLQEIRLLEVHEGWVHLGTTLNGYCQPVCTFLSKGPPSSTVTQEGLAVLTEVAAAASFPERVRRLTDRVQAIALAENGADFRDVYRFFEEQGYDYRDSYKQAARIFRGSLPEGCGPFTKDLSYWKGFLELRDFCRSAFRENRTKRLLLLFCGKTNLTDLPILEEMLNQGLIVAPRFLPPPFADNKAIKRWIGETDLAAKPIVSKPSRRARA
ncbi:MAG: flavohemoglobin expression-modulating QEGLA motif protein [Gemmataceae bacterium]